MATLEAGLRQRRDELREAIRAELLSGDEEHFTDLAGRVHDLGDESAADLLMDLNLASVHREVVELRQVEDALQRIAMGGYGRCVDCGVDIDATRLEAQPTASRCVTCQQRYEETHAGERGPSI